MIGIEMHVGVNNYGMYLPEAIDRWHAYPPPRYSAGAWSYGHPWMWYDGNPHGGTTYSTWPTKITTRMNVPSPMRIRMWGNYNPVNRNGTIYARYYNDSAATINANALFLITQDSIYLPTPNSDQWHNHVARDYFPSHVGNLISIPPGDSFTFNQPYTIDTLWDVRHCEIVAIVQDTTLRADSTKEILQGGSIFVTSLGIEENSGYQSVTPIDVKCYPNPGTHSTMFTFTAPLHNTYQIKIFDVAGKNICILNGINTNPNQSVSWDFLNTHGAKVNSGIYFYQFESSSQKSSGKIIVK